LISVRVFLCLAIVAVPAVAGAEPAFRQVGASSRVLGCTNWAAIPCDGSTQTRLGLTVVDLQYDRRDGLAPVAMFQAAARTADDQLFSQVATGPGLRYSRRGRWLQGGLGVAAWRHAPGPKTITASQILDSAAPALLLGVGFTEPDEEDPITYALDSSLALLEAEGLRTYQLTASLTRRF
jgi:hypothetical protein